jgi:hypothetical protein
MSEYETTENIAVINRSISIYLWRKIPTPEIEQTIFWLRSVMDDCQFKITRLQSLMDERERAQKHRDETNAIARQFCDPDSLHLDMDTRAEIIRQRLGCDYARARAIAEIVTAWAKRQSRKKRDARICALLDTGCYSISEIAKKEKLSRQQVHNIVNKGKDSFLKIK